MFKGSIDRARGVDDCSEKLFVCSSLFKDKKDIENILAPDLCRLSSTRTKSKDFHSLRFVVHDFSFVVP